MNSIIRKNFQTIAGIIFLVVGLCHGLRAVLGWPLLVGILEIPVWFSAVVAIILLYLAFIALRK